MCNVSRHQMERSVRHFDTEHQLLRNENLRLSMQLNMADLEQLMLFQELLILEESKTKRDALQKKLNACIKEENSIVVGESPRICSRAALFVDDALVSLPCSLSSQNPCR